MSNQVAVVGMGYWGKNLVRTFHRIGVLKTVCDRDESRRAAISSDYAGVEFTTDYSTVLRDGNIDAVAIATPAVHHFEAARAAFEAGKDVYVEKPLALTVKEGEQLVALAGKPDRILMVGHILRYHPAVRKLDEMIRGGEIGQIRYVYSNRLNIGKIRTEENILWSFAPHDISVILGLLGEAPSRVSCKGKGYLNATIPDVTLSDFVFPNGTRAHIFVSWLHPFKEQRLVVVGSEKMVVFDDTAKDKLVVFPHRVEWKDRVPTAIKAEQQVVEIPSEEPLMNECLHFVECLDTRKSPFTDGNEGLAVLKVLDLCQRSLEADGSTIDVPAKSEEKPYFVHPTAAVDEPVEIGAGTKIWHFCHIMKGAKIGERCVFGQNCNVDGGVVVGNNVKVQNNVSLYTGLIVEDDVFLGPSCVLTNVTNPRSQVNRHSLYEKTVLKRGCTIGANATVVCDITVGRYAFIGAGAVVVKNVPDYALMVGVPARQKGWVSRHGLPLNNPNGDDIMICPESGYRYKEVEPGILRCLDLDEEAPLPEDKCMGSVFYDDVVHPGERLT